MHNGILTDLVSIFRILMLVVSIAGMIGYLVNTRYLLKISLALLTFYLAVSVFSGLVLTAQGLPFKGIDGPPTISAIFVFFLLSFGAPFAFVVTSCAIIFKIDAVIKARKGIINDDK